MTYFLKNFVLSFDLFLLIITLNINSFCNMWLDYLADGNSDINRIYKQSYSSPAKFWFVSFKLDIFHMYVLEHCQVWRSHFLFCRIPVFLPNIFKICVGATLVNLMIKLIHYSANSTQKKKTCLASCEHMRCKLSCLDKDTDFHVVKEKKIIQPQQHLHLKCFFMIVWNKRVKVHH